MSTRFAPAETRRFATSFAVMERGAGPCGPARVAVERKHGCNPVCRGAPRCSIMISSSMRCWFDGGQVDWMIKTSCPRIFSSIFTKVFPVGESRDGGLSKRDPDAAADILGQSLF